MRDSDLYKQILGLENPWYVSRVELKVAEQRVDIWIEHDFGIIGARTKAALQAKKSQGQMVGHVPSIYQVYADNMLIECPQEQWILSEINILRAEGLSLREIATELNARGILNRGNEWYHVAVKRVAKL
jgi:hypothetical protein